MTALGVPLGSTSTGAFAIANQCGTCPWLETAKLTLPAACELALEWIHISPMLAVTAPAGAAATPLVAGPAGRACPDPVEDAIPAEDIAPCWPIPAIMLGSTGSDEPPVGAGGAPLGGGAPGVCSM